MRHIAYVRCTCPCLTCVVMMMMVTMVTMVMMVHLPLSYMCGDDDDGDYCGDNTGYDIDDMLNCKINSTNRGTFSNSVRKIILMVSMVQGV